LALRLYVKQGVSVRRGNCLVPRMYTELSVQPSNVTLHRILGDKQFPGDIGDGKSIRQSAEHFCFALAQDKAFDRGGVNLYCR
jgi:hypothetical protein